MKNILFLLILIVSNNLLARGGTTIGNGGGAHVCKNGDVRMYDMVEGEIRYGMSVSSLRAESEEEILSRIGEIIKIKSKVLYKRFVKEIDNVKGRALFSDITLARVEDADILLTRRGCEYVQLANWDDISGNIFINKNLFQQLSVLDQVALYVHEALYKIARYNGATNSNKVRLVVASLFSGVDFDLSLFGDFASPLKIYNCQLFAEFLEMYNGVPHRLHTGPGSFEKAGLSPLGLSGKMRFSVSYSDDIGYEVVNPVNYGSSVNETKMRYTLYNDRRNPDVWKIVFYKFTLTTENLNGQSNVKEFSGGFIPDSEILLFNYSFDQAPVVTRNIGRSYHIMKMSYRCEKE